MSACWGPLGGHAMCQALGVPEWAGRTGFPPGRADNQIRRSIKKWALGHRVLSAPCVGKAQYTVGEQWGHVTCSGWWSAAGSVSYRAERWGRKCFPRQENSMSADPRAKWELRASQASIWLQWSVRRRMAKGKGDIRVSGFPVLNRNHSDSMGPEAWAWKLHLTVCLLPPLRLSSEREPSGPQTAGASESQWPPRTLFSVNDYAVGIQAWRDLRCHLLLLTLPQLLPFYRWNTWWQTAQGHRAPGRSKVGITIIQHKALARAGSLSPSLSGEASKRLIFDSKYSDWRPVNVCSVKAVNVIWELPWHCSGRPSTRSSEPRKRHRLGRLGPHSFPHIIFCPRPCL